MTQSPLLPIRTVAKPWGKPALPAPFVAPPGETIGEIWFEPPPSLDALLVKYIFTSEALSVQVHPSDAQTLAAGLGRQGKEECWLVIDAEPGAVLGIGFDTRLDGAALRAAAVDGSIEQLMTWHPVQAGDFFYIPAGTVHAIGAGVSLIEVQQNSDITYRLYDYGRPRALHLDEGMAVARGEPYAAGRRRLPDRGELTLVEGPLFRLDRIDGPVSETLRPHYVGAPLLVIPRSEGISVHGLALAVGQCALARDIADIAISGGALALLARPL
ncbi:class I mannose-6-phosphate isomerase [Novosphingobium piscinae]|uniref:Class I mannose-6-phosphate isomerase n=1 Tax=Novosphingobium piscinae TaxID=1507448 RepID=A0A7X1KP70_9SPHN|nr:class I mannose-6-phosphate isomerase [Novosphingobium piscinae]MBC2668397.1 class I mannose-6-phosphate isomerase [Novosphingobium piscinae]